MDTHSFYTRQMLLQYGKQLVTARRLMRYNKILGKAPLLSQENVNNHRAIMIERVAREITENLIFSGSDNAIVKDVLNTLEDELGEKIIFRFPPASADFTIFRISEDGEEEITGKEKTHIMNELWHVALRIVDATML